MSFSGKWLATVNGAGLVASIALIITAYTSLAGASNMCLASGFVSHTIARWAKTSGGCFVGGLLSLLVYATPGLTGFVRNMWRAEGSPTTTTSRPRRGTFWPEQLASVGDARGSDSVAVLVHRQLHSSRPAHCVGSACVYPGTHPDDVAGLRRWLQTLVSRLDITPTRAVPVPYAVFGSRGTYLCRLSGDVGNWRELIRPTLRDDCGGWSGREYKPPSIQDAVFVIPPASAHATITSCGTKYPSLPMGNAIQISRRYISG